MSRQRAGWARTLAAAALIVAGVAACAEQPAAPASDVVVYRIPVTGVIELGLAPFIERSLAEASEAGAAAAVLELETPGGRVDAAQRIVNAVEDTEIPVYAYVNRRAFSAGAMTAQSTAARCGRWPSGAGWTRPWRKPWSMSRPRWRAWSRRASCCP